MPAALHPMNVSVNGVPLTPLHMNDLVEVIVDTNTHMPTMFTLKFMDRPAMPGAPAYMWIDNPLAFPIGGRVKIAAPGDPVNLPPILPGVLIANGEITAIEPEFNEDGSVLLVVRGYDKTHRLHRGKKTQTFMMMPDNLIWQQVCMSAGVGAIVTPTGGPREYVIQNNQTDWEFLKWRSSLYGYEMRINDLGILQIGPRELPADPVPIPLEWGNDLYSFRPRVSAAGQVSATQVLGYDMRTKLPIVGMFTPLPPANGGATVKVDYAATKLFGATSKAVVTTRPPDMAPDAMSHAKAVASEISSQFVQAEGICKGAPRVKAGAMVTVRGVGVKFTGPYLVTAATHTWRADGEYVTEFSITGSQPDTISDLIDSGESNERTGRIAGVVIGQVSNNMDPFSLGRVKVRFPWLGVTPPIESNWARVATPWAGSLKSGAQFVPEINDEVLVAFEHGDPNRPYVVGSLWSTVQPPPNPSASVVMGGKVVKRTFRGSSGHMIVLDDTPGKTSISFVDKTMMNSIVFDTTKNAVDINVLGDVSVNCLNFKVFAKANVDIKSLAKMDLNATAPLTLKSTSKATLDGTANTEVTAAIVAVKAKGLGSVMVTSAGTNINNGALEVT